MRFGQSDEETSGGVLLSVKAGDVLVIPAGVSHRAMEDSDGFCMVGAYPKGAPSWDMNYGRSQEEVKEAASRIEKIPLPSADPFTGSSLWTKES